MRRIYLFLIYLLALILKHKLFQSRSVYNSNNYDNYDSNNYDNDSNNYDNDSNNYDNNDSNNYDNDSNSYDNFYLSPNGAHC